VRRRPTIAVISESNIDFRDRICRDIVSIAEHGHFIRDGKDFFHFVSDVDDRDIPAFSLRIIEKRCSTSFGVSEEVGSSIMTTSAL
jgi:hypothetical protein